MKNIIKDVGKWSVHIRAEVRKFILALTSQTYAVTEERARRKGYFTLYILYS